MMGLILIGIAFIFLVPAYIQYKKTRTLLKTGITTTAKIVAVHKSQSTSTDSEGFTTTTDVYNPEVEFTTESGQKITYTSPIATSNKNAWKVGDSLEIVYDPDNLKNIKIKKTTQLYFFPMLLGLFGIIFLIIGIVFAITT